MRERILISMKYRRRYSYAMFGSFFSTTQYKPTASHQFDLCKTFDLLHSGQIAASVNNTTYSMSRV